MDHDFDYLLEDSEPPKYRIERRRISPLRRFLMTIINLLTTIALIIIWLGGIAIYLWTVLIAFQWGGFFSAFLTFILPVISQLFWAWKAITITGVFWNLYIVALVAYIGVWVMMYVFAVAMAILED